MNKVILIGRLTAKPEMKKAGDYDLTRFTIAINRKAKNADGNYDVDFIPCVAWNKQAELITRLDKGEQIAICGALQTREYETQDGGKRKVYEVVTNEITFIGNKFESKKPEEVEEVSPLEEINDDDLPF